MTRHRTSRTSRCSTSGCRSWTASRPPPDHRRAADPGGDADRCFAGVVPVRALEAGRCPYLVKPFRETDIVPAPASGREAPRGADHKLGGGSARTDGRSRRPCGRVASPQTGVEKGHKDAVAEDEAIIRARPARPAGARKDSRSRRSEDRVEAVQLAARDPPRISRSSTSTCRSSTASRQPAGSSRTVPMPIVIAHRLRGRRTRQRAQSTSESSAT